MAFLTQLDQASTTDEQYELIMKASAAEINEVNAAGWCALRLVLSVPKSGTLTTPDLVRALLKQNAYSKIPAAKGHIYPIHEAIRLHKNNRDLGQYFEVAKLLFENDPTCLDLVTAAGLNAIHYAAETLDLEMLHWVYTNMQDKQALTNDSNSALHYAGACQFLDGFVALVAEGFDPFVANRLGFSALDKLLNSWPRARHAFEFADQSLAAYGRFNAIAMGFFRITHEEAQELLDEVTEQRQNDWPPDALIVMNLCKVYVLWQEDNAAPG